MTLHLRISSHSEVGLVRKMNQDSGYASPHLLVVADGMGGAAAGDLASAVAIDSIKRLDTPDLLTGTPAADAGDQTEQTVIVPLTDDTPPEQGPGGLNPLLGRFAATVADANDRIADLVAADYALEGMGTTVTGAVFDGQRIGLVHIGDSRAYLLREGRLERLTHDHSWVQSLVDDGKISADEAAYHPHRSLLLKVLNGQPANDPDLTTVELQAGDRLLFCSDGLCGLVDDDRIGELAAHPDLEVAVTDLVDAALAAGGIDNITVILAEAMADGASAPTVDDTGDTAVAHEDEDTAVRPVVPAAVVLGAAADREIPSVPRRAPLLAGLSSSDDDEEDDDEPDEDDTPRSGTATTTTPPATQDDESRYTPGPPAKRPIVRTLLVGLAILLVAAAGLGAGYAWTRTQYFVGAAGDQVAIYQGLPDGIPGLQLSQVYEVQDLPVSSLPPYYQAQVTAGIEVASVEAARVTVEQLREMARRCAQPTPTPKPTATPKPTTTPGATPTPKATPTPMPTTPTPTPTPTTTLTITPAPSTAGTPAPTAPSPLPGQGC
jgi:serine/threonine protein phosphatase PrpC